MQRSRSPTHTFPMGWEDSWCKLPEYEIISKLVKSPQTSTVKEAADAIVKITEKAIDTVKRNEDDLWLVQYGSYFLEAEDTFSEHVLLVFGSVFHLAARINHRDKAFTNLLDFIDELLTREVKASDEWLNKYMDETDQRMWTDMMKTLDDMVVNCLLDEYTIDFHRGDVEHLDSRFALAAHLCHRLYAAGPPKPASDPDSWRPPHDTSTGWTNLALESYIAPVAQSIFLGNPAIVISKDDPKYFPKDYRITEALLRAACIWFLYNSPKIFALTLSGEDSWRRSGKHPASVPLDEWGVFSWSYWRTALETYLGAQRPTENRFMKDQVRFSGVAEQLIKEALIAMDRAEAAGGTHGKIDWERVRDKKEKERARRKAQVEADGEEWGSGHDDMFDDLWYPDEEDPESGSEGEEDEDEDEIHHSDREEKN